MIEPVFKLDSRERWWPQPVETAQELGQIENASFDLNDLPAEGGWMDFPADMEELHSDPRDTERTGYHRCVEREHLYWHQFWLWYLYNPKEWVGFGKHEGDWEFVQIATVDEGGDEAVLVTASQHQSGGKREFWNCELTEDGRPIIYVALGSHANYFQPGTRNHDVADGKGELLKDVRWEEFGPWADWAGRWGNSRGAGKSPQSPGQQFERWNSPELFHSRAK